MADGGKAVEKNKQAWRLLSGGKGGPEARFILTGGIRFHGTWYYHPCLEIHTGKAVLIEKVDGCKLLGRIGDEQVELEALKS